MFKLLVSIILGTIITVSTFDPDFHFEENESRDIFFYMPDGNGIPNVIHLKKQQLETNGISKNGRDEHLSIPEEQIDVRYYLYTKNNLLLPEEITIKNLQKSSLDLTKPMKILIHGWKANNQSDFNQKLKNKYLKNKDCNVVIVDWSSIADLSYMAAALNTNKVSEEITKFLQFILNNGGNYQQIHLIGHSLGAHICGSVGSNLNGRISRITGLDPASPLFDSVVSAGAILTSDSARFVDVIHTCGGTLGFSSSLGTVDFYPNGGIPIQPGCPEDEFWSESCSHSRSWEYFEESIGNPKAYLSVQCDSWELFDRCRENMVVPMGEETPLTARGNFYLRTSNMSPYHAVYN